MSVFSQKQPRLATEIYRGPAAFADSASNFHTSITLFDDDRFLRAVVLIDRLIRWVHLQIFAAIVTANFSLIGLIMSHIYRGIRYISKASYYEICCNCIYPMVYRVNNLTVSYYLIPDPFPPSRISDCDGGESDW
jgi:hypothetical protein